MYIFKLESKCNFNYIIIYCSKINTNIDFHKTMNIAKSERIYYKKTSRKNKWKFKINKKKNEERENHFFDENICIIVNDLIKFLFVRDHLFKQEF